jgi:hypothetical protein
MDRAIATASKNRVASLANGLKCQRPGTSGRTRFQRFSFNPRDTEHGQSVINDRHSPG